MSVREFLDMGAPIIPTEINGRNFKQQIGHNIAKAREKAGYTLKSFCEMTGIPLKTIAAMESGELDIPAHWLLLFTMLYETTYEQLFSV